MQRRERGLHDYHGSSRCRCKELSFRRRIQTLSPVCSFLIVGVLSLVLIEVTSARIRAIHVPQSNAIHSVRRASIGSSQERKSTMRRPSRRLEHRIHAGGSALIADCLISVGAAP